MVRCTHKGCEQDFDPANNPPEGCTYHPGAPIFHEGLKSWSCCSDVNRPVLDFDEFMKLPACAKGPHTNEAPKAAPPKPQPQGGILKAGTNPAPSLSAKKNTETFSTQTFVPRASAEPVPAPKFEEEEDDADAQVPEGTKCRHNGCNVVYENDELHRKDDGAASECTYHPKPPIFHEGSKGYLCCKRRVLEFEEFLKIEGCKKGRHVFVPKAKLDVPQEEFTQCRIDHYQTPSEVHASVFAKKANPDTSVVRIEENEVFLDLYLPASKRFQKTILLWGPVNVEESSFTFYGTKVELKLKKKDARSWTLLEKTERDLGNINFTFGVGGRTGTIGAKELILDDTNKTRA